MRTITYRSATALLAITALSPTIAPAQTTTVDSAQAANSSSDIGEIVVTAQRRSERLTDVPIAITALTGAELKTAGIESAKDLTQVTPGLYYATQGCCSEPTIRGIGTSIAAPGFDANVAVYIDGVYQPSQEANNFDVGNISNIQVLKGPQGTLFGRNSTGGAILVTTLDPSFEPSADVSLSYGRFNDLKTTAYVTGGIAPNLAGNLSVYFDRDNGYVTNLTTGDRISQDNNTMVRAKVLWTPTENWRITFAGNYSDDFNNTPYAVTPLNGNTNLASALAAAHQPIPSDPYHVSLNGDPSILNIIYGGSINAKYDAGAGTLTSITSYQVVHPYFSTDIDATPIYASGAIIRTPERTLTQELDFASKPIGPFSWIGGAYFYHDLTNFDLLATSAFVPPPNVAAHIVAAAGDTAAAIFAEGTYHVTDDLQLIVGGRYSTEHKIASNDLLGTPLGFVGEDRWNSFTPRGVLQYKLTPNSNVYFNYSQGFKSGGYNTVAVPPQTTPVSPEKVNAYEVGYKHSDGHITFNTSAFYDDYRDIQVQIQTNAGGIVSTTLQNAANAKIYGSDFDFTDKFNDNWRVSLGAAYTHGVYNDYRGAIETYPAYTTVGGVSYSNGNTQTASATPLSGVPMIRSPKWMADITPTFDYPLPAGRLEASVTASYNSGFIWALGAPSNDSLWRQPGYVLVNSTVTWISPSEKFRLSLWGTNLTNKKYDIYETPTGTGTYHAIGAPWFAGVRAEMKF